MAVQCIKCNTNIVGRHYVTCSLCKGKFHLDCGNVSEKRYLLMTPEHKRKWECTPCIQSKKRPKKPSISIDPNVTLRRRQIPSKPSSSTPCVNSNNTTDSIMSADSTLNHSCSDTCTDSREDINIIEELRTKITCLESKLESAENEIERLVIENHSLRDEVSKRDAKIHQLSRLCRPSPNHKDDKSTELSKAETSKLNGESCINYPTPKGGDRRSNTQTVPAKSKSKHTQVSTSKNTEFIPTTESLDDTHSIPITKDEKSEKHRISLLSTRRANKVLQIAQRSLDGNCDLCHYLLPNRGIRQLLEGIDAKVADFTLEDYCVIFIGEDDFNDYENYSELVIFIRNTLLKNQHTNILICSPTFKYGTHDTYVFNSRVETFNHLLCADINIHKYGYLLDSNVNLTYDSSMFFKSSGTVNNRGMAQLMVDVNEAINSICHTVEPSDTQSFFRGSTV